jgi:hypothetical protein
MLPLSGFSYSLTYIFKKQQPKKQIYKFSYCVPQAVFHIKIKKAPEPLKIKDI